MNKLKTIIALALPLLLFSLLPLNARAFAWHWTGTRINIFGGDQTVSSSDWSYVAHGWSTWPEMYWSEMSGEERADFMGPGLRFELETEPATFTSSLGQVTFYFHDWDEMMRFWGIQFKPGDLTPGVYTFTGRWYLDYALDWEVTITVTVTP